MRTLARLAIALGIGAAVVGWFWWRYPGELWLATIPWAMIVAGIMILTTEEREA